MKYQKHLQRSLQIEGKIQDRMGGWNLYYTTFG